MLSRPALRRSLATLIVAATVSLAFEQTLHPATTQATRQPTSSGPITTPSQTRSQALSQAPSQAPSHCEARTINYITHALPQSCLTSSWASADSLQNETAAATSSTLPETSEDGEPNATEPTAKQAASSAPDGADSADAVENEVSATPFMSFEDWKELMLRKAGQDPQELRQRKATDGTQQDDRYKYQGDSGYGSLGEEGEISLVFGGYPDRENAEANSEDAKEDHKDGDAALYEVGQPAVHRSKDAGKTCKERFSFASFDAGATILKTSAGAKNSKAILVENKDSYMLLECATQSKYVIVELTDDIWVDTIVLANFEFFSSMIRHFRVSVSDRYPVKMEKWKELGTYEARNSRDIQAFLIENPQIWAKYVRIEFLTHYGNEYYCPVSLIRVHGSRMLDKWKDSETASDEDAVSELDGSEEPTDPPTLSEEGRVEPLTEGNQGANDFNVTSVRTATHPFHLLSLTCPIDRELCSPPVNKTVSDTADPAEAKRPMRAAESEEGTLTAAASVEANETQATAVPVVNSINGAETPREERVNATTSALDSAKGLNSETSSQSAPSTNRTSTIVSASNKARSTGANIGSGVAAPTVQEGFFNSMTKRLQQVESNLTLSLKYVEEQSKHVQDAFQRSEQKQLVKITSVLTNLNDTVLAELRNFRDQYDQIWQSTVLALESQKDQSQRDILALSSRLNVLADEVVFQKRMAIVQAVLLLSCLCLVTFARGGPIPYLAATPDQSMSTSAAFAEILASMQRRDMYPGSSPTKRQHTALSPDSPSEKLDNSPSKHIAASPRAGDDVYGYRRPSPPLTPNRDPEERPEWQSSGPSTGLQTNSQIESQHINSRQPLPALPENPASPGPS
jgi:hypothetical protein